MKEKYYILSCSFGKDSLYLLHYLIENNYPLNEVQFVEPMFEKNVSGLLPNHRQFIDSVINRFNNVRFNIIKSDLYYYDLYLQYGCPTFRACHWCTGQLKLRPLNIYNKQLKQNYDVYFYVGLCSNEKDRVLKNKNKKLIYPLFVNNINEDTCFKWCKDNNLLSPIYNSKRNRDGCWFCPFQSKLDWLLLKLNYSNLFNKMCDLEQQRLNLGISNFNLVRSKPLNDYLLDLGIQTTIYDFI